MIIITADPRSGPSVVTVDFDHTLKFETGTPNLATIDRVKALSGAEVHIVTSRDESEGSRAEIDSFLAEHRIPHQGVHFTNGKDKAQTLLRLGSELHFDDDFNEGIECGKAGIPWVFVYDKEVARDRLVQALGYDQEEAGEMEQRAYEEGMAEYEAQGFDLGEIERI
jgi:hypothetical protein